MFFISQDAEGPIWEADHEPDPPNPCWTDWQEGKNFDGIACLRLPQLTEQVDLKIGFSCSAPDLERQTFHAMFEAICKACFHIVCPVFPGVEGSWGV